MCESSHPCVSTANVSSGATTSEGVESFLQLVVEDRTEHGETWRDWTLCDDRECLLCTNIAGGLEDERQRSGVEVAYANGSIGDIDRRLAMLLLLIDLGHNWGWRDDGNSGCPGVRVGVVGRYVDSNMMSQFILVVGLRRHARESTL